MADQTKESTWQKLMNKCPATRVVVGIMLFFACWVNYMMRVNMSVNIIAMVPPKHEREKNQEKNTLRNGSIVLVQREHVYEDFEELVYLSKLSSITFDWSEKKQGLVLAGYFWGYAITCGLGGIVGEYFGPKRVIATTMGACALATLLSPASARLHYIALTFVRFLAGCTGGFLFPSMHAIVARWAPPAEKGKFVSAMLGGAIGTVVTWSLTGPIINAFGWETAFYIVGVIGIFWCAAWLYLVYDNPLIHPRISQKEKDFIMASIGDRINFSSAKSVPPFKKIFTSIPFIAYTISLIGSNWGLYFVMTAVPKFMSSCLKFNLTKSGSLSSLPYLARMIFSLIFGSIGDWIIKRKLMSTTALRKFFTIFSHIIPGLILITIAYSGCGPAVTVALLTLMLGNNGAACLTCLANGQDLAPNYAGSLFGMGDGIATVSGFLNPLVTAHFTQHGSGWEEWRPVFIICACMYIGCAIIYMIFGSGVTQPWNFKDGQIPK